MKKTLVLFLLSVITFSSFAQNDESNATEKNVLKVNTLALITGTGTIFYERKVSDLVSAQMGAGYMNYNLGDSKFTGLILTPEARFYVKKNAIDGFYIAPYLRYTQYKYKANEGSGEGSFTSMGGGAAFGMQWILKKGFTMDLFFGGHYTDGSVDIQSGTEPSDITKFEGFKTRVGFCLGFAF